MATITNLNAHALMNSAKALINTLLNNKKVTIKAVVKEWNICVEQSGLTTVFDFPVEGWTRKAFLISELERCAEQLHEMAFAVEAPEALEVMVQDIKAGDSVLCPTDLSDVQTVVKVDGYSSCFKITFSGSMGAQIFVRGETLLVCDFDNTQITNVSNNEEGIPMNSEMNAVFAHLIANNNGVVLADLPVGRCFIANDMSLYMRINLSGEDEANAIYLRANATSILEPSSIVYPVSGALNSELISSPALQAWLEQA